MFREGSNGNGIIWAVPADAPLVAPNECPRLEDTWLHPPRPPGAVPLMHAIEGNGSPWSYLSASILSREAAEFGALWHGCVWSDQTILSKPPRQADGQETSDDARTLTSDAPVGHWTWHGAAPPRTWKPTYTDRGTTREVVLHIHHPIGREEIYRATDTYPAGSYEGKTETTAGVHGRPVYRLLTDVLHARLAINGGAWTASMVPWIPARNVGIDEGTTAGALPARHLIMKALSASS